jgi:hypothetical protein
MGCVIRGTGGITLCGTTTCRTYKWSRLMQIHVCIRPVGNRLIGLSGVYVDDMLHCGTLDFLRDSKTTSLIFGPTPETMRSAKFAGVNLRQTESGSETDLSDYIEKLTFPLEQSWKHFASFCAKIAWLVYARPDICAIAKLAQVTEQHFRTDAKKYFRMLEDCFQQVRKYDMFLNYPALALDSLYIRGYADASFGKNVDGSSQIGYCILLMDKFDRFAIIKFRSGKCHRVTHSAMAAETCAFIEVFDAAFVLKLSLGKLLKRQIRSQMLSDSKQLFDAISHSTQTKEKRILIDIAASKQSFERFEISDPGLVAGRDMLADCFKKVMEPIRLMSALESGFLRHQIKQRAFRDF